ALKQENCTVCYKCSRECPDWCIYIDAHKETHEPASGGRARSVKVLDRFAIDFALCMYCGICIEACPFDALFWSPEFEYAEYDIRELTHERERLREWMWTVPVPPAHDPAGEPAKEVVAAEAAVAVAAGGDAPTGRAAAGRAAERGAAGRAARGGDAVRRGRGGGETAGGDADGEDAAGGDAVEAGGGEGSGAEGPVDGPA